MQRIIYIDEYSCVQYFQGTNLCEIFTNLLVYSVSVSFKTFALQAAARTNILPLDSLHSSAADELVDCLNWNLTFYLQFL